MNFEGIALLHWKGPGWYFKTPNNRAHRFNSANPQMDEDAVKTLLSQCHPAGELIGYLEEKPVNVKNMHIFDWTCS